MADAFRNAKVTKLGGNNNFLKQSLGAHMGFKTSITVNKPSAASGASGTY